MNKTTKEKLSELERKQREIEDEIIELREQQFGAKFIPGHFYKSTAHGFIVMCTSKEGNDEPLFEGVVVKGHHYYANGVNIKGWYKSHFHEVQPTGWERVK